MNREPSDPPPAYGVVRWGDGYRQPPPPPDPPHPMTQAEWLKLVSVRESSRPKEDNG